MAQQTTDGRIALAESLAARQLHLAWGRGNPGWGDPAPIEPLSAIVLEDEICRRLPTETAYVTPDSDGDIELPDGSRWTRSPSATRYLFARFHFDFADAAGETLREIGLFVGGATDPALPPGQRLFVPAEVTAAGRLYLLERFAPLIRDPGVREDFVFVLTF